MLEITALRVRSDGHQVHLLHVLLTNVQHILGFAFRALTIPWHKLKL